MQMINGNTLCAVCGYAFGLHSTGAEKCPQEVRIDIKNEEYVTGYRETTFEVPSVNVGEQLKARAAADELAASRDGWPKKFESRAALRRVEFYRNGSDSKTLKGYFHGWGMDSHEVAGGTMNYSVAIVETIGGNVWKINPEDLTFLS